MLVDGFYRNSGTHHDHHQRFLDAPRQHAVASTHHGHPAVGTQSSGMVVAIDDARFFRGGHHPLGRNIPEFHLLLDTSLDSVSGHHTAQHARGHRQVGPRPLCQSFDVL